MLHYTSLFIRNYAAQQFTEEIGLPELLTMQSRIILEHRLSNDLIIEKHGCYLPEYLRAENRLSYGEVKQQ